MKIRSGQQILLLVTAVLLLFVTRDVASLQYNISAAGSDLGREIHSQFSLIIENVKDFVYKFDYVTNNSLSGVQMLKDPTYSYFVTEQPTLIKHPSFNDVAIFPWFAFGISVVHSGTIKSNSSLLLDRPTLAEIFAGTITKWNHANISSLNPGVTLPDEDIIRVVRSDENAITKLFTEALSSFSTTWNTTYGSSNEWPSTPSTNLISVSEKDYESTVLDTPYSIGYAVKRGGHIYNEFDLINRGGVQVSNNVTTVRATVTSLDRTTTIGGLANKYNIQFSLIDGNRTTSTWPICGFTYVMIHRDVVDDELDCYPTKGAHGLFYYYFLTPASTSVVTGSGYHQYFTTVITNDVLPNIKCNNKAVAQLDDPKNTYSGASTFTCSVFVTMVIALITLLFV